MNLSRPKFSIRKALLIAGIAGAIGLVSWYIISAKQNDQKSPGETSKSSDNSSENSDNKADDATTNNNNKSSSGSTINNQPFKINRVYFAEAPKVPPGAGFGQCAVGQVVQYKAISQVTSNNKGKAEYHWEVADHLGGTISKQDTKSLEFNNASTQSVSQTFSYTVRNVGNGSNLNNRQFINLFVTSPNSIYANIEKPVYAYKNGTEPFFVWGTYIDLC